MWEALWAEYYIILLSSCSQLWHIMAPLSLKLNTCLIWVVAKMAFQTGHVFCLLLFFCINMKFVEMYIYVCIYTLHKNSKLKL